MQRILIPIVMFTMVNAMGRSMEEDKKIKRFIRHTVIGKHEKGYQKNKKDRGNYVGNKLVGTKYGISAPTLKNHLKRDITEKDMKNLKQETAESILFNDFYKKSKIDTLPKDKQEPVLDYYINSGPTAIKTLQKRAGIKSDGHIGKNTIKAIESLSVDDISDTRAKMISGSNKIDPQFKKGLLNRTRSFTKGVTEEEEEQLIYKPEEESMAIQKPIEDDNAMFRRMRKKDEDDRADRATRLARENADAKILQEHENYSDEFGTKLIASGGVDTPNRVDNQASVADQVYKVDTDVLNQVDVPIAVRKDLQKKLLDTDKKVDATKENFSDQEKGNQTSVKSQFMSAMTLFLPDLVGMAVGGVIGGAEGASEGARLGGRARDSLQTYKQRGIENEFKDRQLAQKGKLAREKASKGTSKLDITSEHVDKETGEPRWQKSINGIPGFVDDKGNRVAASSVELIKSRDAKAREERLLSQSDRNFSQAKVRAGNSIVKDFKSFNKTGIEQVRQISLVRHLVAGGKLSKDQLATFNAKAIFGESRITDEDVARAVTTQSVLKEIKDRPVEAVTGKLGPERQKQALEVLDIIERKKTEQLRKSATKTNSPLRRKASGLTQGELQDELERAAEIKSIKKASKKKITESDIDKMSLEELKAAGLLD